MGYIVHLRNSSNQINTSSQSYYYFITLIKRKNFLKIEMALLKKIGSPSPMYALCHVSLKLAHWFWRGGFFQFCQCIYASLLLSPLGKGYGHSFEHSPHLRVPYAKCLIEIGHVVLEEMIFKVLQCIFPISLLSPLGKRVALHLNKLESTLPKNALCQVWLKLA